MAEGKPDGRHPGMARRRGLGWLLGTFAIRVAPPLLIVAFAAWVIDGTAPLEEVSGTVISCREVAELGAQNTRSSVMQKGARLTKYCSFQTAYGVAEASTSLFPVGAQVTVTLSRGRLTSRLYVSRVSPAVEIAGEAAAPR